MGVAWLMWSQGLPEMEAIKRVQSHHPWCDLNLGFVGQLRLLNASFEQLRADRCLSADLSKVYAYYSDSDLFYEAPPADKDKVMAMVREGQWGSEVSPVFILVYEAMTVVTIREGEERTGTATLEFLRLLRKFTRMPKDTYLMNSLN